MGKDEFMSSAGERLDVFDGLRGCAILLVVCYHVWLVGGPALPFDFIAEAGYIGVDLFFFISGFCLYYPYANARSSGMRPSTRRFFVRRALKIVPSYLLALGAFALVYRSSFASPLDAAWQLATHLTFLHPLWPDTFGSISGPLWTIGIEVEFYLLFPLVVRVFARAPIVTYVGLAIVAEGYRAAVALAGLSTSFWCINQLPAVIDLFAAGMIAAHALVALRTRADGVDPSRATIVAICAGLFGLVGLGLATVAGASDPNAAHDWINAHRVVIGPLCFTFALAACFAFAPLRAVVAAPPLVFLSAISYNLYLWHLEIIVWFRNAGLTAGWLPVLALPVAIGVAALVTYRVERPLLAADVVALANRLVRAAGSSMRVVRETTA
jgi:peptidoglycan/LPS O-acetylase OafA/YrhL